MKDAKHIPGDKAAPATSSIVSPEGVDQAVQALGYRSRRSQKYRLVHAIRERCQEAGDAETVTAVPTDDLIRLLWEVDGDGSALVSRRRNLSSLRSSINADLMALYHSGENPEGVIIGPEYTFIICEEAKDQALQALRSIAHGAGAESGLQQIGELLQRIQALLDDSGDGGRFPAAGAQALEGLLEAVQGLAAQLGAGSFEGVPTADSVVGEAEPEDEAAEVVDDEDLEDAYEDVEVVEGEEGDEEDARGEDGEIEGLQDEVPEEEDEAEAILEDEDLEDEYEDVEVVEEGEDDGTDEMEAGDAERSRLLAEEFNRSLAAMDRFYNQYVLVPEGSYPVHSSSSNGAGECLVTLSAFYIGKFPVTNAMFELFVERTGYMTTAERLGWGMVYQGRYRRETDEHNGRCTLHVGSGVVSTPVEGACWYQPEGAGSTLRGKRNHPVVQVSLEDAMAFAAWTGKRLPTEEEWEAAMRTGDGNLLPWGDIWTQDSCNVEDSCIGGTSPVDRFMEFENPLGVADGLGNVLEWTSSGGRGKQGVQRIARGGGWIARRSVTLADSTDLFPDARSNILGFRCVAY